MANLTPTGSSGKSVVPSLNHTGLSRGLKDREHTRSFSTRLFGKHTRSLSTRSSGNTPDHLVLGCQEVFPIAQMLEFQGENCTFRITLIVITLGLQPEYFPPGSIPECFVSEPLSFLSFTFIDYWDRRINQPRRDHSTIYLHQTSLPVPQVFSGIYGIYQVTRPIRTSQVLKTFYFYHSV